MKCQVKRQSGFSLLEAIVVIGIMMLLMGMAIIQSFGSTENYIVNSALDTVTGQLRVARQIAINQRRNVLLTISTGTTPQTVSYQVVPVGNEVQPAAVTVQLPPQTQFILENGVPDTPMNFGNSAAIYIGGLSGGPATMQFTSTGQFTDGTGFNTMNGTLFIGIPNQPNTARAVTIMGGTGRVRPYTYLGNNTWTE